MTSRSAKKQPPKVQRERASGHSRKAGLPPGSIVFVGRQRVENVKISIMDFNEHDLHEEDNVAPEACRQFLDKDSVTWINVTGLHDTDLLSRLADIFNIHLLALEDIVNTGQRPKFEDHGDLLLCIVKMLYRGSGHNQIVSEQVSMVLGPQFLITFQEVEGDVFDVLRERIRSGSGRVRKMGGDYLAYALLDAIVDNYFIVLEDIGDKIEDLQERILEHPEAKTLQAIHALKRDMVDMRRNLWPMRELVSGLDKSESSLLHRELKPYLRDLYEHIFQVIDTVELWRDLISGALDVYMTSVSNRMNEVMKVLTIIATIFIPLTFVAGIYGMNFEHMPELHWRFAYPVVWAAMLIIAAVMALLFKKKNWW